MASNFVVQALEKIASRDRDHRYMGLSDLLNELNKVNHPRIEPDYESKLCNVILQQINDSFADISALAIKCLSPLTHNVSEARTVELSDALFKKLSTGKDQQRAVASIALKAVIAEVNSPSLASKLSDRLSTQSLTLLTASTSTADLKCDSLDILTDVLNKFGSQVVPIHEPVLNALLSNLPSTRPTLRKKSVHCLASLAPHLSEDLLAKTVGHVIGLLQDKSLKGEVVRSNIQLVGTLSRSVGYRFGPFLEDVIPLLSHYCQSASENDDEIREYSIQALESFVTRCAADMGPHKEVVLTLALSYLGYDPNYNDNMEEEEEEDEQQDGGEEEDEEEEETDEDLTDDDDVSWKVRRAAAKCVSALIASCPEMLPTFHAKAAPRLIERFREREEGVKGDVFTAFIDLLQKTGPPPAASEQCNGSSSPHALLREQLPLIVRSLTKQFKEKSLKSKVGAFSVLKELLLVLPSSLSNYIAAIVPGIKAALTDKASTSNLKIEALSFTRLLLATHPPSVFHRFLNSLLDPVLAAVSERYYKVAAEALRVSGEMVKAMRPNVPSQALPSDYRPLVLPLYTAVFKRFTTQDQDQEVKECAIATVSLTIAHLGDELQQQLPACLPLLIDRLRNDITRLPAVKAFATIADSPLVIDITPVLANLIAELTLFLRRANRGLRQSSIATLATVVRAYQHRIAPASLDTILQEVSPLISDADLPLAALSLDLCCTVMAVKSSNGEGASWTVGASIKSTALPRALSLVHSPLLQGHPLQVLQNFFVVLGNVPEVGSDSLLYSLLTPPTLPANKAVVSSAAQCAAAVSLAAGTPKAHAIAASLVQNLSKPGLSDTAGLLSLLCLGEIGSRTELSSLPDVDRVVTGFLQAPSDELKSAASFALGGIASSSPNKYLPFLLTQISTHPNSQYLLLHSLKEVISRLSVAGSSTTLQMDDVDSILQLLFSHSASAEEGVRNVVAECLGKLALLYPSILIPKLKAHAESADPHARTTAILALKFSIVDAPHPADSHIQPTILSFLLLADPDKNVRRAAVSCLSAAAHNKASMVVPHLPQLLPLLYQLTSVNAALIRTVEFGPFKHSVDDGLDLRKAAFDCVDTLLSTSLDHIQPSSFLSPFLIHGLKDVYDVKMPCHLILSKLASKCGVAVLAVLDPVLDALEKTVSSKVKQDAVKQEVDRNDDLIKSALRAFVSISKIQNVESRSKFQNFVKNVTLPGAVATLYSQVVQESEMTL